MAKDIGPFTGTSNVCVCGHRRHSHTRMGVAWCERCGCQRFRPAPLETGHEEMIDVSEETRLRDGIKKAVFELLLIHHPVRVTAEHDKFICPTCALTDDDAYGEWPCHTREIVDRLKALIQDGSDGDD